jgi:hypothetical protein
MPAGVGSRPPNPQRVPDDDLAEPRFEARAEAAPFVALALLVTLVLAGVSASEGWELFGHRDWWIWLVEAVPLLGLAIGLLAGFGVGPSGLRRRELVIVLIGVVVAGSVTGTAAVVISLATSGASGGQLLASAATILLTNIIAFGLALWELDCGGPVRRRMEPRVTPDLQFPQDENPSLARKGWTPHLLDYVYVSLTNSVAFSPTDTMPLTRAAKALMALESVASSVTVLVVAARAINILG